MPDFEISAGFEYLLRIDALSLSEATVNISMALHDKVIENT